MFLALDQEDGGVRKIKRAKGASTISLKLTSLMDMFTILVVFLLKNFSAEGEIMAVANDLRLPESSSAKKPMVASVVAVNQDWLMLDGEHLANTAEITQLRPEAVIDELKEALVNKRAIADGLGEVNENMAFSGKINIQADKSVPYIIVKKIMMTCGRVGYNDIMLAVMETD
ncbi:biopolymer transporter ExbD [candidate division KSB1 bacterium]|nr:biopolymer transporter ExbD [candidate division KSB1 bacterium]